jgi:hypothetical protein
MCAVVRTAHRVRNFKTRNEGGLVEGSEGVDGHSHGLSANSEKVSSVMGFNYPITKLPNY